MKGYLFTHQQAFHSGGIFRFREKKNPLPGENISLLNLHVTPGLDLKNTFICKLIAFISPVTAFNLIFFSGYFNWVPDRPHSCQAKATPLL